MKKKLLSILLAACMIVSASPVAAYAGSTDLIEDAAEIVAVEEEEVTEAESVQEAADTAEMTVEASDDEYSAETTTPANEPFAIKTEKSVDINPNAPVQLLSETGEGLVGADDTSEVLEVASLDELVETYRSCLVKRKSSFTISMYYEVETDSVQEAFDAIDSQIKAAVKEEGFKHTGVSNEGDYLRWQTGARSTSPGYKNFKYDGTTMSLTLSYTFTAPPYATAEEEAEVSAKLADVYKTLDLEEKSDYDRVLAIHDWICANVTYDYEHLSEESYLTQYTAYGALIKGTSVCQGYANLFYRMCLDAGVDVRIVTGTGVTGTGEGGHAWNIVRLGGKYYTVDVTWDDSGDTNNNYEWFLKNDATFFNSHLEDEEYQTEEFTTAYPLADSAYVRTALDDYPDDKPLFLKQSLTLGSKIGMDVFMKLPNRIGFDYTDSKVVFTVTGKVTTAELDSTHMDRDGILYGFTCGVSSIQMAEKIHAEFHYKVNGVDTVESGDFSVEGYINSYLESYNAAYVNGNGTPSDTEQAAAELVKTLSDYGYHAQDYFGELRNLNFAADGTGDYMAMSGTIYNALDGESGDNIEAYLDNKLGDSYSIQNESENIKKISYSLKLDSGTDIIFYLVPAEGFSGSISLVVGESLQALECVDGVYKFVVSDIPVTKLYDKNTYEFDVNGENFSIENICAMDYAKAILGTTKDTSGNNKSHALMRALVLYEWRSQDYLETLS